MTLGAVGIGVAYADGLDFTADGLTSLGGTKNVAMCAGQASTFDVIVVARRNGSSSGNIFKNGSTVNVALDSISSPLSASLDKTTITVPNNWSSGGNNTLSTDSIKATFTVPAQTASGSGTAKFSYSGINASGGAVANTNTVTVNWTVTQCDKTPPTLHLPGDFAVEATGASGATVTYTATADDAAPAHPAVTCAPASGTVFALGVTKVSCSATDTAGNKATGDFTVTVRDTTPPVISNLPNDISMEATGATTAVTWSQPTALDAVSGSRTVTCSPASGTAFTVGNHTIGCSATDAAGNQAKASFKVNVGDTTKPTIGVPSNIVAEATGPDGAAVNYDASADDIVDGAITPVCDAASGSTFALGTTTVTCTATDAAGNEASGSFTVTVEDTTAPDVTVPGPQTIEATGPDGAVGEFTVSASDLVSGAVDTTCDTPSGSTLPLGTTTVTCSATDAAGNEGHASFDVTVRDTTPPTITVPDNQVLEATGPDGATATFTAKAKDLVDGTFDATCTPASGSTFAIGSTAVDCTATDKAGNHADSKSFAVVVRDTTPPTVTVPDDFAVEATGPNGAPVDFTPSADDIVDGSMTASCDVAPGDVLGLGSHKVTCTATDAHNNTGTASFTVTVQDTTPPAVNVPKDMTAEATGPDGASVSYNASATDLVDGAVIPSCSPVSGSTFALGTTTVTCSATDAHGNSQGKSFSVKVQDTTAPEVSVPGEQTVEATGPNGAAVSFTATAKDIVDGVMTPACLPASGTVFPLGKTSVVCTATDAAENPGKSSFSVTVRDTTKPVITWVGGPQDGATYPWGTVPTASGCTATDLVSGSVPCQVTGYDTTKGVHTVTATATDGAGNFATAQRTYTVASWKVDGFFQPVDMGGVVNTVKAGSTVPLKFRLTAGDVARTSVSDIASFQTKNVDCKTLSSTSDPIDVTTTGGTSLRYDATANQFIQNWQVPKGAGICYIATMTAKDGTAISASFMTK